MAEVRNPQFERKIRKDPHNRKLRSVYGDWLLEQGDPRGEIISLELAVEAGRIDGKSAVDRLKILYTPYKKEIDEYKEQYIDALYDSDNYRLVSFGWKFGFVDTVYITTEPYSDWSDMEVPQLDDELLDSILVSPITDFMTRLYFMPYYRSDIDLISQFKYLSRHALPCLDTIVISGPLIELPNELNAQIDGMPNLRELCFEFTGIDAFPKCLGQYYFFPYAHFENSGSYCKGPIPPEDVICDYNLERGTCRPKNP